MTIIRVKLYGDGDEERERERERERETKIQTLYHNKELIPEQHPNETNPIFQLFHESGT